MSQTEVEKRIEFTSSEGLGLMSTASSLMQGQTTHQLSHDHYLLQFLVFIAMSDASKTRSMMLHAAPCLDDASST
eukprot:6195317-Pleurochrysis_carterae.AAC.6